MATKTNKLTRNEMTSEDLYTEAPAFTETGFIRREDEQDWDYNPDGELEVTEELKNWFAERGGTLRWVRHTKDDKLDSKNLAKSKKKGYEFVKFEELPPHLRERFEGQKTVDGFDGYVTYEDLVLMVTPTWKYEIVKSKIEEKATRQLNMVNDLLRRDVNKAGVNTNSEAIDLINDSKTSKVKVGGSRRVDYSKRRG